MRNILLLLTLVLSFSSSANDIYALLNRQSRPTMLETLPYLNDIQEEPGIPVTGAQATYLDSRIDIKKWLATLLESTPQLIATTEILYPNAVWVFLGRDTLAISDVFEAYYHSIGQENRVVRLGVSKASFLNVTKEELQDYLNDFLKDRGFSWLQAEQTPFVLMDSVSSGYGRQGRDILAAMYKNGIDEGESIFSILDRLNILGLKVSTFGSGHEVFDVTDAHFQQLKEKWRFFFVNKETHPDFLFKEKTLLTYSAANEANEAGYTHYIGAWHNSYGAFSRSEGKVDTLLGKDYPVEMKKSILWTQKKIWEAVRSRQFKQSVESAKRQALAVIPKNKPPISRASLKRLEGIIEKAMSNKERTGIAEEIEALALYAQKPETFEYLKRSLYTTLNDTPLTAEILYSVNKEFMSTVYFKMFLLSLGRLSSDPLFRLNKGKALSDLIEILEILDKKSCESALSAS